MTTILDPARPAIQAVLLRAHLRLIARGMKNSRISRKEMLARATALTGEGYINDPKGCARAIDHLTALINASDRLEELTHAAS